MNRLLCRHRETGSLEPLAPRGGSLPPLRGRVASKLKAPVLAAPDATVAEMAPALQKAERLATSRSSVQPALTRLGSSRNRRSFVAVDPDIPHHLERRRVFCALMRAVREKRLVFIDESFCKTGMCREHGWSLRGSRVIGPRPLRSWKTVSVIGAIRPGAEPKLMTHPGTVSGPTFLRFVRTRLVPWFRPGDVVVMDNLNIHEMREVRVAIEVAGGTPSCLPTYGPELSPIGLPWANLKRSLRTLAISDQDELRHAVGRPWRRVPTRKIAGWFGHALASTRIKRSRREVTGPLAAGGPA